MTVVTPRPAWRRVRAVWDAVHAPVPGVPRWARVAAYAVPFTVLPAGLWRIGLYTFRLPLVDGGTGAGDGRGDVPAWLPMGVYVVLLSVASELLAFTAVGLVGRWGEVVPRWVPWLGGRRVATAAAAVPAALGAAILTVLWTTVLAGSLVFRRTVQGRPLPDGFVLHVHDWRGVLAVVAYVPLAAWGPLLAALTYAYCRRRARGVYGGPESPRTEEAPA